ncbi:Hsp33 family molecular chaperone HslO [Paracoccaceae bacterium]|nr:Hsp33 family molecular chaperone HslO [Paracoccaceae bacterium]
MKKKFVDAIIPFQLGEKNIRGRFTRIEKLIFNVLKHHRYPPQICHFLIESIVLTILIGDLIKLKWRLSLQIRGEGPIKLLATDYYAPQDKGKLAKLRAYADFDKNHKFFDNQVRGSIFKSGLFAITIDQGKNTEPYQGITPVIDGNLIKSAENYFYQSEQIKTSFVLEISRNYREKIGDVWNASGFMLQALPENNKEVTETFNWKLIKERAASEMKIASSFEEFDQYFFLDDVFRDRSLKVFQQTYLKFGCSCNKNKLLNILTKYRKKEVEEMTGNSQKISANCQFCGKCYEFSAHEIFSRDAR